MNQNELRITEKLISYNDLVILVPNISSVDITKSEPDPAVPYIKMGYSPVFFTPKYKQQWILMVFSWIFLYYTLTLVVNRSSELDIKTSLLSLFFIAIGIYLGILRPIQKKRKNQSDFLQWKGRKESWEKLQNDIQLTWEQMERDRIESETYYILNIHTNSGNKSLFINKNIDTVREYRDKISEAMVAASKGVHLDFSTKIINDNSQFIDNRNYSTTYNYIQYQGLDENQIQYLRKIFTPSIQELKKAVDQSEDLEAKRTIDELMMNIDSEKPNKDKIKKLSDKALDWCRKNKSTIKDTLIQIISQGVQILVTT